MRKQLSEKTLELVDPSVEKPLYDRRALKIGIVHLGLGAFHRAHQAVYTHDVLQQLQGEARWGIAGVSLRSPHVHDMMAPQDDLYSVTGRGAGESKTAVIGVIKTVFPPAMTEGILKAMREKDVKIVSMTVTEKGYCLNPATGRLNKEHLGVKADLEAPERPKTAFGLLAAALRWRKERGMPPFTVLCCDNLPQNGIRIRRALLDYCGCFDEGLAKWVEENATFPCNMVDRIVPAATEENLEEAARLLGVEDQAAVIAEPFKQWVIEDRFVEGRPHWELAGAVFAQSVRPFEEAKLRLLNGCHSALAYLGYLSGKKTISDVLEDPPFESYMRTMMLREIAPTLEKVPGLDLAHYQEQLIARFANPVLRHLCHQIAMDGSQKMPQRILNTVRDRLSRREGFSGLALAIAAWMIYASGKNLEGHPIEVSDPLSASFPKASQDPKWLVAQFLKLKAIFGEDLSENPLFEQQVSHWAEKLYRQSVSHAIQSYLTQDLSKCQLV